MAPGYIKLAKRFKKEKSDVVIAECDATKEAELAKRFKIEGYPTLRFFVKGKLIKYEGEREE